MRPFNLEEYLKNPSQKVMTRDGRKARILCTDMKNGQPILALITEGNREDIHFYYQNGVWSNDFPNHKLDLVFASIKKEGWINIYKGITEKTSSYAGPTIYKSKNEALENKVSDNYITTTKIEWKE